MAARDELRSTAQLEDTPRVGRDGRTRRKPISTGTNGYLLMIAPLAPIRVGALNRVLKNLFKRRQIPARLYQPAAPCA
jgi:hypothetical protein